MPPKEPPAANVLSRMVLLRLRQTDRAPAAHNTHTATAESKVSHSSSCHKRVLTSAIVLNKVSITVSEYKVFKQKLTLIYNTKNSEHTHTGAASISDTPPHI